MTASLLIAVRFHEGRYHGQGDGFDGASGWPPSPGRLFQALVAGAARGARLLPKDGKTLKWLERLDPPRIAAPAARPGRATKLFVPNNDLDAVGGDPMRVREIRVGKQWRPCFFDHEQPILYVWDFESGLPNAEQVCDIASRLYQLGRGIDMAWASGRVVDRKEAGALLNAHPGPMRTPRANGEIATPHRGSLDSLIERYQRKRTRLTTEGTGRRSRQLFAQPPKASFRHTGYDVLPRCVHFELRGPKGEFCPRPLVLAMPVVVGLRDAAARRLQKSLPAKSALFERLIVGRGAGPQDLAQRIRMIPVPSIGTEHTDPSIRRVLIEIPADCSIRVDDLTWAFAGLSPYDPQTGEVWMGSLVSTDDFRMAERFMRPARTFRTLTPAALPSAQRRRLAIGDKKTAGERSREEGLASNAVIQALRHAGVSARPTDIGVQREPFHRRSALAEQFDVGPRFSKHALWHVELRFAKPIAGPLVIGDGRFCGLGLMEPVDLRPDVVAFHLGRRVKAEHRGELVRHLRRALMALARDDAGRVGPLFSGHEPDGSSDRQGHHAHVFLVADSDGVNDGSIMRLVVAAPWAVDHKAKHRDRRVFDEITRRLVELRAGRVGRFHHLTAVPVDDGDRLIGPALRWVGKSPYVATRNLRTRNNPTEFLRADVVAECVRRDLPTPTKVEVSDLRFGPKGGRPAAELILHFAVAVRGPLVLGRDSHMGGGLFHAVLTTDRTKPGNGDE